MYKNKKILAIIPARGESKSIPKKNIKKFSGKPLIAWTILTALKSKLDKVVVTTDDSKIAEIAKKYGAEVPFLRPKRLATNSIAIEPVLRHTINWLKINENYCPDGITMLLPTNPLRQSEHINKAIKIFIDKQADCVISVSEAIANHNPYWMLKKTSDNNVVLLNNKPLKKLRRMRRQTLPKIYFANNIIHLFKPGALDEKPSNIYGDKIELYIMDEFFDGDIDTPEGWRVALDKFKRFKKHVQK